MTSSNPNYDREQVELMNFLIEKTKDAKSPLNVTQLAEEFEENSGYTQGISVFVSRIGRCRSKIHQMDSIDMETKVKMIFALGVSIDENLLNEIRMNSHVEVDEKKRITKYRANNGSLELTGDHSQSANAKEGRKRVNAKSVDGFQDSIQKTPGSVKRAAPEVPNPSKRTKTDVVKTEDSAPEDSDRRPGLSDMPIEVMDNIVENLNLMDKLSTRKVSRTLRAVIDNHSTEIQDFELCVLKDNCMIRFAPQPQGMLYTARENGRFNIQTPRKTIYDVEGDYLTMAMTDLASIIGNPKWKFKTMRLSFAWEQADKQDHPTPLLHLNSLLSNHEIYVERLIIAGITLLPAVTLLPRIKADSLKKLYFGYKYFSEELADQICEMDQWKSARKLDLTEVPNGYPIEKLFHCERFRIWNIDVNEDRLQKIRDILFNAPIFNSCKFFFDTKSLGLEDDTKLTDRETALRAAVDRVMGAHTAYDPHNKRYQIEGSNDYFSLLITRTNSSSFEFEIKKVRG